MSGAAEHWGGADYELFARRLAPVQDALVAALEPRRGERWLDVATGTGEVAIRAARAGADVVGLDIAPRLLDQARAKAAAEGLEIRFDEGDAQEMPYEDESFDVVASSFGAIFPPDHAAVAAELARVVRRGGRLGLTAHRPMPAVGELLARHGLTTPEGPEVFEWGVDGHAESLLSEAFELDVRPSIWWFEGATGEEIWDVWRRGAPPTKAMVDALDDAKRAALRADYVAYYESFREGDRVRAPRDYLLILGRRR